MVIIYLRTDVNAVCSMFDIIILLILLRFLFSFHISCVFQTVRQERQRRGGHYVTAQTG